MSNLKAKLKKQEGFTLIEMLIVVAIIAILVAISIPLVNNALERAKHATDAANERAAKAEILIQYLADGGTEIKTDGTEYYYDAVSGSLKVAANVGTVAGYGKHGTHKNQILAIKLDTSMNVTMVWTAEKTAVSGTPDYKEGFCSTTSSVSH